MQLFASVRTFRRGGQKALKADKLAKLNEPQEDQFNKRRK